MGWRSSTAGASICGAHSTIPAASKPVISRPESERFRADPAVARIRWSTRIWRRTTKSARAPGSSLARHGVRAPSSYLRYRPRRRSTTTSWPTGSRRSRWRPEKLTHSTTGWPGQTTCLASWPGAFVQATRAGLINGPQRKSGHQSSFAVDFKGSQWAPRRIAGGARRGQRRRSECTGRAGQS